MTDFSVIQLLRLVGAGCLLLLLSISRATSRNLPDEKCENYDKFMDDERWDRITQRWCSKIPGTKFHCQDLDGRSVSACLVPKTCELGQFPSLTTEDGKVNISCIKCDKEHYQPEQLVSYKENLPGCREKKQSCQAEYGMTIASEGDAAHDRRCRCLWEEGWAPDDSKCNGRQGFVKSDFCYCEKRGCPQGKELNQDYVCVSMTTPKQETTETPCSTDREHVYIPVDRPFPGGLKKKEESEPDIVFIIIIIIIVLILAIAVCVWSIGFGNILAGIKKKLVPPVPEGNA